VKREVATRNLGTNSAFAASGTRSPSSCLAIARIFLTCLRAVTKQRIFLLAIVA
jgi:hypothetical protein